MCDLSASSSVTSLLRGGTGLPRGADAGDLLLEVDDVEEKFFWDLVREPLSSDTSSLAVAFRMLLEKDQIKTSAIKGRVHLKHTQKKKSSRMDSASTRTHLKDGFWLELLGVSGFSE